MMMVQCDLCGFEVLAGPDRRCPDGHALPDPSLVLSGGEVAPLGDGRVAPAVAPSPQPIPHRAEDPSPATTASSFLGEALTALGEAHAPATPARPPDGSRTPLPTDQPPEAADAPDERHAPFVPTTMDLFGKPQGARPHRRRLPAVVMIGALVLGSGTFVVLRPGRADAATYRLAFVAGESHRYAFRMTMSGTVSVGGIEQPMDATLSMDLLERVTAISADGVATVRQQVQRASFTMAGQRVQLPRTTVTMHLSRDGRILQAEGIGGIGCAGGDPAGELFGPGQMYPAFSPDAVGPGDGWTVTQQAPNPLTGGTIPVTMRNRLVAVDGDVALMRSDVAMPLDMRIRLRDLSNAVERSCGGVPGEIGALPAGARFDYDGDMRMQLTQTIDRATGRPITVTGTGAAAMTLSMDGLGGLPSPEISMDFTMEISFTEQTGRVARDGARPGSVVSA